MDNKKFEKLMYGLLKNASRISFVDFLETWDISEQEYGEIKKHLESTYGIKLYLWPTVRQCGSVDRYSAVEEWIRMEKCKGCKSEWCKVYDFCFGDKKK